MGGGVPVERIIEEEALAPFFFFGLRNRIFCEDLQFEVVIHEGMIVEIGIADRGKFHGPEFDKEMMPFLDD